MEFLISSEENDKTQVKNLWKYCFEDTDEYISYYFDKRYRSENNYIIKDKGEVLCSLTANKYNLKINDDIKKVSYIVGVSSSAVHRGLGYASKMINNTLVDLYTKGEDITMLMPIDTFIYTRYGFANIYNMLELDIPIDRIKMKKTDLDVVFCDYDKIPHLIDVYSRCMSNMGTFFVRDSQYFKNMIDEVKHEQGNIIICYEDNTPIAYMVFFPKYVQGQTGFVREIFSLKKSGYDKLMEIVKSHFTQVKNVIVHSYEKSDLYYYFNADNKISYKTKPFMMSRILNATNIFKDIISSNMGYEHFEGKSLRIRVFDEIIHDNNKVFEINLYSDDKCFLEVSNSKADLEISIYELSALVFGYIDIENLMFEKEINLNTSKKSILRHIFPYKTSYFNDYV